MGAIKNYFKQQFQSQKFGLEYEDASDFYMSPFQGNRSTLPLLILRGILFLGCLSITISSFALTAVYVAASYWPIYMTHWGLVLITLASGFAFGISIIAHSRGCIGKDFFFVFLLIFCTFI